MPPAYRSVGRGWFRLAMYPMSFPAKSLISSGPIGMPKPRIAASTSEGVHPSSSMKSASATYPSSIRLPMKPLQLPASTAFFLRRLPSCMIVAIVSLDVCLPLTFSRSGITCAGLKKCIPATSCGRLVAAAISSMSRYEVLLARMAVGLHKASSLPKISFFTSICSNAASTTMSASRSAGTSSVVAPPMSRILASTPPGSFPFLSLASYTARIPSSPRASAASPTSTSVTATPALAKHMAIPHPIVPAPTTAARAMSAASPPPLALDMARSAKKACCSAAACSPAASWRKSAASASLPAAYVGASTAARTASSASSGACSPRAPWRTLAAASEKKASAPPGAVGAGRRGRLREGSKGRGARRAARE
mmetsp:Transcript_36347/g.90476  ORF Transcript_36347/g.90476 Transcript_36347/m.90476 type:complete len:366 (-) Transcript_36347:37-1134(-)